MLYKYLFSIVCGHLNLNQKRKKIEFGRLLVKPISKPVKPAGKDGFTHAILNLIGFYRFLVKSVR